MKNKIIKSLKLWDKAKDLIPKGTQTMSKGPDQFVFGVHPIYLESGKGCYVKDIDNNSYIDHMASLGPIILGHNHKRTVKAIKKQLKKGITFSLMHPLEVELAELLTEVIPCAEQVRYAKNGTDAVLAAVRVARSYTGRDLILKPEGHYHGWSDWHVASTTHDRGVPKELKPLVKTFEYNKSKSIFDAIKEYSPAAVIMEPVSLEEPNPGYLQFVRDMCDQHGVVLIFDEMITGFRWALGGAQEYYGVTPDIATFGKAVANGMPLSIIAGKKEFMQEFNNIFFSMTFGGEACSLAAAVETIKEMKEKRLEIFPHIWEQGARLRIGFNERARMLGVDAEMYGHSPWHNIRFNVKDASGAKDLFHQEMVERGILMGTQIYTTWAHKAEHIDKTLAAIQASLWTVSKALGESDINRYLKGRRSSVIFKKEKLIGKQG